MQVTVSRVSPVVVNLRVELPQERVSSELQKAYNAVSRDAQIKGFRKGKVPRPLLKQYYGPRIELDVANNLVSETLDAAIRESKVETIGAQPKIDTVDPFADNKPWSYVATVEVRPEISEINYGVLTLTKKVYTIDEHDIDGVINEKREEHSTVQTPEPMRPAQKTDSVTFDWDLVLDGTVMPEFAAKGRTAELGRGVLFPEVEAGLLGVQPGEEKAIDVTFPESHSRKELAGKTATLNVRVTALQEKILPAVDDELAKDLGAESLDALRATVRADLEKKFAEKSSDEVKDEAINLLVKAHEVDVPPSLLSQILQQMRQQMVRGFNMKGNEASVLDQILTPEATLRARAGLLLTEIARQNGLLVTDADLTAAMEEIAKERSVAVQRVRAEYQSEAKRQDLIGRVLEDKVTAFLLSKATITEVTTPTHTHDEAHEAPTETK